MKDLSGIYSELVNSAEAVCKWHMPHMPQIQIPRFDLHIPGSARRPAIETYIHDRFASVHRAEVSHFLPNIISLGCGDEYSAAVGLAPATSGKLFAEQYLSEPIEQVIGNQLGFGIARDQIMEIGNLASTGKGGSLLLFIVIGEVMERLGYHYVLFTGTREVKALLARLRYSPVVLADADPGKLPDSGASWGNYYVNQPQVMFGDNRPAMAAARKNPMYRATVALIDNSIERLCVEIEANSAAAFAQGNYYE